GAALRGVHGGAAQDTHGQDPQAAAARMGPYRRYLRPCQRSRGAEEPAMSDESTGATRWAFEQFTHKRDGLGDGARATAIARQHELGKLSARERIALLLDHGSFHEVGGLVEPKRDTFDT